MFSNPRAPITWVGQAPFQTPPPLHASTVPLFWSFGGRWYDYGQCGTRQRGTPKEDVVELCQRDVERFESLFRDQWNLRIKTASYCRCTWKIAVETLCVCGCATTIVI